MRLENYRFIIKKLGTANQREGSDVEQHPHVNQITEVRWEMAAVRQAQSIGQVELCERRLGEDFCGRSLGVFLLHSRKGPLQEWVNRSLKSLIKFIDCEQGSV